ncbi:SCO7613 C-terminal domain-containing membrane protein [Chengkuizengella marina]|uniref:DUF2157 domain-containing protein n=1 Tax=Chengkuizengella marina TaxID=2507566 RepID=A0A6N9Q701_9BACL|nr:hypothetical protein [Chengkuizengella marina]NBI30404.1 hypothetical protein [Chengkuizengella marina]
MKHFSKKERNEIFNEELDVLHDEKYIQDEVYENVKNAHQRYVSTGHFNKLNKTTEMGSTDLDKTLDSSELTNHSVQVQPISKPQKPKKIKTPDQKRDQNITWTLILGVILLLISGLYVATSNWSLMASFVKMMSIAFVSVLFFVISWFSYRVLKIEKTAFAFLTLASLFIPIIILSAGYFQLLNEWFSLKGEGKYLFLFTGSFLCIPLYIFLAQKFKSRMFAWISFITSSLCIGFLLASFQLTNDAFYFGIMLYNAMLLYVYHKWNKRDKYRLFVKELPNYAQLNLVLSTFLMLMIFENAIFYSFNVILTAVLYISMVFVYQTKQYHFVFSALLVYGLYQFIENSFLLQFNVIFFALIGFLFIGLQILLKEDQYLKKMFEYTSAMISFCAFIYISFQGILLQIYQPSAFMFLAYILISLNYLFLAYKTKLKLFSYLTSIFIIVAGYESFEIVYDLFSFKYFEWYMFGYACLIFSVLYFFNQWILVSTIKISSLIISILTMIIVMGVDLVQEDFTELSLMLFIFGFIIFAVYKSNQNILVLKTTSYIVPSVWLLSGLFSYDLLTNKIEEYEHILGYPFHFNFIAIALIMIQWIWKNLKENELGFTTFVFSQISYTIGLFLLLHIEVEEMFIRPVMLFVGIGMYILLAIRLKKIKELWLFSSVTSVLFLLSLLSTFDFKNGLFISTYLLMIPIILLSIYEWAGRKYVVIQPYYFWTAQLYLPVALIASILLLTFNQLNPNVLFIGILAYIYSTLTSKKEWTRKLFLYMSFTVVLLLVVCNIIYFDFSIIPLDFALFITSMMIGVSWLIANMDWRKRIDYYLIPISMIGIVTLIDANMELLNVVIGMIYILFTLYLLHQRKWTLLNFIPLLLSVFILVQYKIQFNESIMIGVYVIGFVLLKTIGEFCYKRILIFNGNKDIRLDWYTLISVFYIIMTYQFINFNDPLWIQLIPAILTVYWVFSQNKRVNLILTKKIIKTLSLVSLLYPYYILILNVKLPKIIEMECYVLPWIVLTVVLSKITWQQNHHHMKWVQTITLLIVSIILVVDAQLSYTMKDAIILGTLSLISLIAGLHYKMKSYFFIGSGVLLLNLFIQTKPLWGNAPWWVYLLVAGMSLIGFASYYEWQKKNRGKDRNSNMGNIKKMVDKLKEWD